MKGIRRVMQGIIIVVIACLGWMAASQISAEEILYPAGTSYQTWADFTDVQLPKAQVIKELEDLNRGTDARVVLVHAGSDTNDVDLIALAHGEPAGATVRWYASSRHGTWLSADALNQVSLTGSYAFSDAASATRFSTWLAANGGSASTVQHRAAGLSAERIQENAGMTYAMLALLMTLVALAWAHSSQQYRARTITVMSGVLPRTVLSREFGSDMAVAGTALIGSWVVTTIIACCLHGWRDTGRYLLIMAQCTCGVAVIFAVATLIAMLALHPRVRDIASRRMPYGSMRGGNAVLSGVTVMLTIVAMTVGVGALGQQQGTMRNLSVWNSLNQVVSADMRANATEQYWQEYGTQLQAAFEQLESEGNMALSESVSIYFTPSSGAEPSAEQIQAAVEPFDDVVVCNPTFLAMFHVSTQELTPVSVTTLPPSLQENITEYGKIWFTKNAGSMSSHLYRWRGTDAFPSLDYEQATGSIRQSRNPLIILVDDPAQMLDLTGFLLPALSTGNLVFSNADVLRNALEQYGVSELIASTSTIADAVYTRATWLRETIVGCGMAIAIAVIATVMIAIFSARTWSDEHRHEIFVRHVSGERFRIITRHRVVMDALLLGIVAIIAMVTAPLISVVELPKNTIIWVCGCVLAMSYANACITVRAACNQYLNTVNRE